MNRRNLLSMIAGMTAGLFGARRVSARPVFPKVAGELHIEPHPDNVAASDDEKLMQQVLALDGANGWPPLIELYPPRPCRDLRHETLRHELQAAIAALDEGDSRAVRNVIAALRSEGGGGAYVKFGRDGARLKFAYEVKRPDASWTPEGNWADTPLLDRQRLRFES